MTMSGSAFPSRLVRGVKALWRRKHLQVGRVGWRVLAILSAGLDLGKGGWLP